MKIGDDRKELDGLSCTKLNKLNDPWQVNGDNINATMPLVCPLGLECSFRILNSLVKKKHKKTPRVKTRLKINFCPVERLI